MNTYEFELGLVPIPRYINSIGWDKIIAQIPMGGLFTVYGAGRTFQTAADMEPWFNHKLGILGAGNVTGMFEDLVMCHMDISLRNLILDKAGRLWILDWAWAGLFPQAFEKASLLHKRAEDPTFSSLKTFYASLDTAVATSRF